MQESAGTLLYRRTPSGLEVLLVHPSGNYHRISPWSRPKGRLDRGEPVVQTARGVSVVETGVRPAELIPLGHVDYSKSRKRVHCFAGEAPQGAEPRCASWEVDRAEFVPLDQARTLLHPDQLPFLERLTDRVTP